MLGIPTWALEKGSVSAAGGTRWALGSRDWLAGILIRHSHICCQFTLPAEWSSPDWLHIKVVKNSYGEGGSQLTIPVWTPNSFFNMQGAFLWARFSAREISLSYTLNRLRLPTHHH